MQHHQGGAVGYLYGPPPTGVVSLSPATMPVSSAPYPSPMLSQPTGTDFEELAAAVTGTGGGAGSFHQEEDDMPVDGGCGKTSAGEAGAGGPGSRWPREETLALIGIRSEMDAAFRNAALKAPVWEEVSRKLAELGYCRSSKKCKEKFENVDKYYKRTKEGRAGRQDGKSYRFFSELEALHAAAPQQDKAMATTTACSTDTARFPQPLAMATQMASPVLAAHPGAGLLPDLSFSSNSESDSDDESDDEEEDGSKEEGFGKLTTGGGDFGARNKTMMALFEGMINRITEKQDASHRLFLETLEKWEADRIAREDSWRRQELARTSREREQHARERAASAARDAALIAFLQRVGGNSVLPSSPVPAYHKSAASLQLVVAPPKAAEEGGRAGAGGGESSGGLSRWPKEEVEALIQLRMEKDEHYQGMGTGAKGPLWEDISAGMRRIGYNRSSKRCKEKWENINKYFKKVKESRKRRPEDSKTCPYFNQLDAIYRKRQFAVSGGSSPASAAGNTTSRQENAWRELEGKISNDSDKIRYIVGGGSLQAQPGNGEASPATTVLDAIGTNKKAEDSNMTMATEANLQSEKKEFTAPDLTDSDDIECNYADEGDEDRNEDGKMKYMIEFQNSETRTSGTQTPTVVASSAPTSSTFLAVQ